MKSRPHIMDIDSTLRQSFGHDAFRAGQREAITSLLEDRPALALFPTGAGKSLCYQLPAILLDGLTLVVSPLIALMRDQVDSLTTKNIAAARLDSSLEANEVRAIYDRMDRNELKLLFVAPERLANEGFLNKLHHTKLSLLAIDEAHCISEWGHNFRPDYLKLGQLAQSLNITRVLALTATATPNVARDICDHFQIAENDFIQTPFHRPNLHFSVTPCANEQRKQLLLDRLKTNPDNSAIVYVTLQQTAEEIATFLSREGLSARAYHAGLPDDTRAETQNAFMSGQLNTVVATIAFGMGIDKANIRAVYHYNLPKSLENYTQESGRAGRDGHPAHCEILACGDDRVPLENFVFGDTPSSSALKSLVEQVLLQGTEFDISRYELAGAKDIRPLVVATALTYLELDGLITSLGPFYSKFNFQPLQPIDQILAGHDDAHQNFLEQVFAASKKKRTWFSIEVAEVASHIECSPEKIRTTLNDLAQLGELRLKPSGLRHAYRLNPHPEKTVATVTADLERLFTNRETGELARLNRVFNYCETTQCLTQHLLEYFGESLPNPCGTCSNCLRPKTTPAPLPTSLTDELSPEQIDLIHAVAAEKHHSLRQPRQLTRFLCGISSPAASRARLNRHDHFGALTHVPFQAVLTHVSTMILD
ncbi:MAG: RecQ family ATP-dependent DNA helicase [Verrucomicrobiota bacterium]